MAMEYADSLQKTITQIAHRYNLDLTDTHARYFLENHNGILLVISRLESFRLILQDAYRRDDTVHYGRELQLFTGQKRWAPLQVALSNGTLVRAAHVDLELMDVDIFDAENYKNLNRGARHDAESLRDIFLGPYGISVRTVVLSEN